MSRRVTHIARIALLMAGLLILIGNPPPAQAQDVPSDLLGRINALRQSEGLAPLAYNGLLATAAQNHSDYLASHPFADAHTQADGSTPQDRAAQVGYSGYVGENVVGGSMATLDWAWNWWMNSGVHRSNILGNWTEVGVGYAVGTYGKWYTLVFGRAGRSAGSASQPVRQPAAGSGGSGGGAGGSSANPPPATARPRPTKPPTATFTPSMTFTPTLTYTPRATFTPTYTHTPEPPTPTPIVLAMSPQPTYVAAVATVAFPADTPIAAAPAITSVPTPDAPASAGSPAPGNSANLRSLIPLALIGQAIVIGGLLISAFIRRRR